MSDLTKYGNAWLRHLRIAILRALLDVRGGAHESLIVDMVNAVHIRADREQVRVELAWLHGEGMVIAEIVGGSLAASLTEFGRALAEGRQEHEGVKPPNVTAALGRTILELSLADLKR